MSYSLIEPKLKPVFSLFTRFCLLFIALGIFLMISFNVFIILSTQMMRNDIKSIQKESLSYQKRLDTLEEKTNKHLYIGKLFKNVENLNKNFENDVKNTLSQVPDGINLTQLYMDKYSLVLRGIAQDRDLYDFDLALPLKARYDISEVKFYLDEDFRFSFISTNKIYKMEDLDAENN